MKIDSTRCYTIDPDAAAALPRTPSPVLTLDESAGADVGAWLAATGIPDIEAVPSEAVAALLAAVEPIEVDPAGDLWLAQTTSGFAT